MHNDRSLKTVLITGGNTGIGLCTVRELARRGHRVIVACRNEQKAEAAMAQVRQELPGADLSFRQLDLGSLDATRQFAEQCLADGLTLDALINNAGLHSDAQHFTPEGFEMQIGVNYLGPFLLTHLLLPALQHAAAQTGQARLVHLSSLLHILGKINTERFGGWARYSGWGAYTQSKLANAMFNRALSERLSESITSNALHPGAVDSDIYRDMPKWQYALLRPLLIQPERAANLLADMAVDDSWAGRTGKFISAHGPLPISRHVRSQDKCRELYQASCALVGVEAITGQG